MEDNESIGFLTLQETADLLRLSTRTMLRMAKNRQFPAFKVGGQWRISKTHLAKWMADRSIDDL